MATEKRQRQKARQQAEREGRAAQLARQQRNKTIKAIIGLVALVFGLAFIFSLRGGDDGDETATGETTATSAAAETTSTTQPVGTAECPEPDHSSERRIDFDGTPPFCLTEGATYEAVFDTSAGEITVALDTERTPETVNNFVFLARYGYYDGTELFRTDPSIDIIQGGAPHTGDASDPGPGYTIADEGQPFSYSPGDLVMARTAAPNSASAQFFFSAGPDTVLLNPQGTYVTFGRTTEGLDVLEAILASHLEEPDNPLGGRPDPVVTIRSVRIVES